MKNPKISVILSAYNAEAYISEAVESVLNQTFSDFEFIIFEDRSTDRTLEILKKYSAKDSRIVLIEKTENKGFAGFVENLNSGIENAKGKYIARMDADDICHLERFQKQWMFLEQHPEIFMVGSSLSLMSENGTKTGELIAKDNHKVIECKFNMENALFHPVIMFRNNSAVRYRDKMYSTEDFDFYLQHLSQGAKFANLPDKLLDYRLISSSISRTGNRLVKMLFLEQAKLFFVERKKLGKDNYDDFMPDDFREILNPDKMQPEKTLLFALDTALLYGLTDEAKLIYRKLNSGYHYKNFSKKLFLNQKYGKIYSFFLMKKRAKYGLITQA